LSLSPKAARTRASGVRARLLAAICSGSMQDLQVVTRHYVSPPAQKSEASSPPFQQ
jgi:hypothetical protein